jgi:hypothetical protein
MVLKRMLDSQDEEEINSCLRLLTRHERPGVGEVNEETNMAEFIELRDRIIREVKMGGCRPRQVALARILAEFWGFERSEAHDAVVEILKGDDAALQERILSRVGFSEPDSEHPGHDADVKGAEAASHCSGTRPRRASARTRSAL